MNQLIVKPPLELQMVPAQLTRDFERMVLECYFDYQEFNLHAISDFVEDFSVYAESFERTGNPFSFHDEEGGDESVFEDIRANRFYELADDVYETLMYNRLFFLHKDFLYRKFHNMPIAQVW